MKLIIGLGNPGKEYESTRHNVGFIVVDNYVNGAVWKEKYNALYAECFVNKEKVIFIKPMTFMNLSGSSVVNFTNFYKINSEDILVIHDDIDLPAGTYRLKYNSSSGGHNGIKDIINKLGTQKFSHLKIGVGKDNKMEVKDFVLSKLTSDEKKALLDKKYIDIINSFIINGIDKTMNDFN